MASNIQIVKEYERAVIFRLGRITDRKPKGPGLLFIVLPDCTLWDQKNMETGRLNEKLIYFTLGWIEIVDNC